MEEWKDEHTSINHTNSLNGFLDARVTYTPKLSGMLYPHDTDYRPSAVSGRNQQLSSKGFVP